MGKYSQAGGLSKLQWCLAIDVTPGGTRAERNLCMRKYRKRRTRDILAQDLTGTSMGPLKGQGQLNSLSFMFFPLFLN